MSVPEPSEISDRVAAIRADICDLGVDPTSVDLVVVTKTRESAVVESVRRAGIIDVGENYAQELLEKASTAPLVSDTSIRWHFIGQLQSNKVRLIADHVALWQSVDRQKIGAEIAKRVPGAAVLVQVNVSGESQKGGCAPESTAQLVDELLTVGLDVRGLMTVAELGGGRAAGRQFASLRRLVDDLGLATCSMGMSGDYREAVAEGASMLRLGTAVVGARPSQ